MTPLPGRGYRPELHDSSLDETEIRRHDFSTFLTETPSMAEGGPGVVVPGCPACRKRLFTMANFTLYFNVTPNSITPNFK